MRLPSSVCMSPTAISRRRPDNSAYVDAYRNGGGEKLEGHDNDKVTQQTKQEYSDVAADIINLVQTGIDGTPYIVTAILAATAPHRDCQEEEELSS